MTRVDLSVAGQELQLAVQLTATLEVTDEPLVHSQHGMGLHAGVAQQHVLLVVVTQHERRQQQDAQYNTIPRETYKRVRLHKAQQPFHHHKRRQRSHDGPEQDHAPVNGFARWMSEG